MRPPFLLLSVALCCLAGSIAFGDDAPTVDSFRTASSFAVDSTSLALSSAVGTVEPRLGAPGYSWLRVHFYAFSPRPEDLAALAKGDVKSMDSRWTRLADKHDNSYNVSQAVLQLSIDKDFRVWQVDVSVPGHSCTVAPDEASVKAFLQDYSFDGRTLKLRSKGSYICGVLPAVPTAKYAWNLDVKVPVFRKQ
jgi:hypothetical protein